MIRKTIVDFQACFPPVMMSACVKWAKEQVDTFNVILTRQLSSTEPGSAVYTECVVQVKDHGKMLNSVGLDFKNLIGNPVETMAERPLGLGLR